MNSPVESCENAGKSECCERKCQHSVSESALYLILEVDPTTGEVIRTVDQSLTLKDAISRAVGVHRGNPALVIVGQFQGLPELPVNGSSPR